MLDAKPMGDWNRFASPRFRLAHAAATIGHARDETWCGVPLVGAPIRHVLIAKFESPNRETPAHELSPPWGLGCGWSFLEMC